MFQWYLELNQWVLLRVISWYSLSSLDPLLIVLKWNIDVMVNSDLLMLNGLESHHGIEYSFHRSLRKPMFTKCLHCRPYSFWYWLLRLRTPTVKFKIPGKLFLKSESRTSVAFTGSYWKIAKVKNYNFNVTEVLVSDFKNTFPEFSIPPLVSYLRLQSDIV